MRTRFACVIYGFVEMMGIDLNSDHAILAAQYAPDMLPEKSLAEIFKRFSFYDEAKKFANYQKDGDVETLTLDNEHMLIMCRQKDIDGKFSERTVTATGFALIDHGRVEAFKILYDQESQPDLIAKLTFNDHVHLAERAMEIVQYVDRKWDTHRGGVGGHILGNEKYDAFQQEYWWAVVKDHSQLVAKYAIEEVDHEGMYWAVSRGARITNMTLMNAIPQFVQAALVLRKAMDRGKDEAFQLARRYFLNGWRARMVIPGPSGLVEFTNGDQTERYRIGSDNPCSIWHPMKLSDKEIKLRDPFSQYLMDLTAEDDISKGFVSVK